VIERAVVPGDSREDLLRVAAGSVLRIWSSGRHPGQRLHRRTAGGLGVAAAGSRIALIGPEADACIGASTTVIEARGQVIAPGFVDRPHPPGFPHRLDRYLESAIPTGLTAFVTETPVLCTVGGFPAVEAFLAHLARLPITAFARRPPFRTCARTGATGSPGSRWKKMARLLEEPGVLGLGEIYWPPCWRGGPMC